jgi:hypothetical protein
MMEAITITTDTTTEQQQLQLPPEEEPLPPASTDDDDDDDDADDKNTNTDPPQEEVHEVVESRVYRDALGRPGLFTGTMMRCDDNDDNDTAMLRAVQGTMDYQGQDEMVLRYTGRWGDHDGPHHWHDDESSGQIYYKNGDTYVGQVRASVPHGHGTYRWNDGRIYRGEYDQDRRHGHGVYEWPDGQVYEGDFYYNRREGNGRYRTGDGQIQYQGQWTNGQYQGRGTYEYVDPQTNALVIYTGEFHDGKPHGNGQEETMTDDNGKNQRILLRQGVWKEGVYVDPDTEKLQLVLDQPWFDATTHVPTIYRGLMNDDRQPHGNGTAVYHQNGKNGKSNNGEIASYEGCWAQGKYHGQGRLVYTSGEEYCGMFCHGEKHGAGGIFKWTDGRQYCGEYQNNQRTGHGIFTWQSGDRYDGEFVNGKRSGYGTFVFDNGAYYSGEWRQGVYHGRGKTVDASGASYVGDFAHGQRHGVGEERDPYGRVALSGRWSQGRHESATDYVEAPSSIDGDHHDDHERSVAEEEEDPARGDSPDKNGSKTLAATGASTNGSSDPWSKPPLVPPPPVPPPAVPGQRLLRSWENKSTASPQRAPVLDPDDCMAVVDRTVTDGLGCPGLYTGIVSKKSNCQPHGVGRLVYTDGKRIHEGFWHYGTKEGHGRCLFLPQYDFHEGEYHDNLRHGPGRYSVRFGKEAVQCRRYVNLSLAHTLCCCLPSI